MNVLLELYGPSMVIISLCRYLMDKTTAAHFSLRQQKITLANRPSPGQPITTSPGSVQPLLVIPLHTFIKQAGNRSHSILRLSIKKLCYNSYPLVFRNTFAFVIYRTQFVLSSGTTILFSNYPHPLRSFLIFPLVAFNHYSSYHYTLP